MQGCPDHTKAQLKKGIMAFTVEDVLEAGFTLEPIICKHCKSIGNVVFHQYIGDGYCEKCGKWQIDVD
jgi:hypothetical protein